MFTLHSLGLNRRYLFIKFKIKARKQRSSKRDWEMLWALQNAQLLRRSFSSSSSLVSTIKQILSNTHSYEPFTRITAHGWVKSVRRQKNVTFIAINDGSTLEGLQAVVLHSNDAVLNSLNNISTGASVRITGDLIKSPGKSQDRELRVEEIEALGLCDPSVRSISPFLVITFMNIYGRDIPFKKKTTLWNFSGNICTCVLVLPLLLQCYELEIK